MTRTATCLLFAIAITTLAAACTSDDDGAGNTSDAPTTTDAAPHASGPSAGCDTGAAPAPGATDHTIRSRGVDRVYQLDVPTTYDGREPFPLVFGLHSLTVDNHFVLPMIAAPEGAGLSEYIGVAPSGRNDGTRFWNAAPVDDNYDVAFIGALLDDLEATLCVDTGRVFATGMSNGAQMSSLLACTMPERIAGIAPIAGVEFLEPCTGAPVPVIAFHGTADPIVLYDGGGLNAVTIADNQFYRGDLPPGLPEPHGVEESMDLWAEHNGCTPDFAEEQVAPSVRHRVWSGCEAATALYIADGAGHTWPGKPVPGFETQFGPGTTEIDASTLLFTFFAASPG